MENRFPTSQFKTSNSFYGSKSGFITTFTRGDQQEDIRKSRIEHLPSYKKVNLSGKLQFLIVFQSIQIQRLSLQVGSLRVMLKDADRQIRNYLNYQVQIKELTENCHQLEEQRINYQAQIQQMSLACNSLYEQLAQCKKQCDIQVQNLKGEILNNKNGYLKEVEGLKDLIKRLEGELAKKIEGEKESQNKVKMISQELVRLNQNMYKNQEDLQQLRDKETRKSEELTKLQHEAKAWQNATKQEKTNADEKISKIDRQKKEKESQLNNLQKERQRLSGEIEKTKVEMDDVKKCLNKESGDLSNCRKELDGVKKQREEIKKEFYGLQEEYNGLIQQSNLLEKANKQLEAQLKGTIDGLGKEKKKSLDLQGLINTLKGKIDAKAKEVQQFKKVMTDYNRQWQLKQKNQAQLTKKLQILQPILAQKKLLQQQIHDLNSKITSQDQKISTKEKEINEATMQIRQLTYQIQDLNNSCQRSQSQVKELQKKLQGERQGNERERKRLMQELQRESIERKNVVARKEEVEREVERLKREGLVKEETKNQVRRLAEKCKKQEQDIETMKGRFEPVQRVLKSLRQKCISFNEVEKTNTLLKKQIDASLGLTEQMITKISSLSKEIDSLADENWQLKEKLRQETLSKDEFSAINIAASNRTIDCSSLKSTNAFPAKPFESSVIRKRMQNSPPPSSVIPDRLNFNAEINVRNKSKTKSIIGEDRRILQPSAYIPARESNYTSSYSSAMGSLSSRGSSGFGIQRRQQQR